MSYSVDLYAFVDWRAYVRAWLCAGGRGRTRTRLAKAIECSAAHVTHLLSPAPEKQRDLAEPLLSRLIRHLGLDADADEFFRLLVQLSQAEPGAAEFERLRARLDAIRRFRHAHRVALAQLELFARWERVALLALAESRNCSSDPAWLAGVLRPRISLQEAQRSIDLLTGLGLVTVETQDRLRPTNALIVMDDDTPDTAERVREARRKAGHAMTTWMLKRAASALTEFSPEERYFNAGTALVPESRLPELRRMFQRWQAEWIELCARPDQPDLDEQSGAETSRARVYRLNLQFFPLSDWVEAPG